jgi:hypothetical protein
VRKVRWLPAIDAAAAERQRTKRAARGDMVPVEFIITGVPRSPEFAKWQ